jgi:tetratricopeptide (TPR) repeat protein
MKKSILILITTLSLFAYKAQSQTVDSALTQTYNMFGNAKVYPQMLAASNQFKLIARQWPDNWITNYYAAWSIAVTSYAEPNSDKKDAMLDEADTYFKKIEKMDSTNDEVAVLAAFIASARISVAPMSRYGTYGKISHNYLDLATKINPNNPRIYYMRGNALFYTPKMFGGGPDKALPLYEKAASLFPNDSQDIEKPHWGMKINQDKIDECHKEIDKK